MEATQLSEHRSYCRFCPALCGIVVTTDGEQVVRVRGDADHPLSRGYTCPKGRSLGEAHHSPSRLDEPMIRRGGQLVPVTWQECLADITARLQEILRTGTPDHIGAYLATASSFDASGRRIAERFLSAIGSRSRYSSTTVDTPCKPLISHLMSGYPGLVPALDHDDTTLTILIGVNPVVSHGHLNAFPDPVVRLRELAGRGEVWVIDPMRTETARLATRHLQPRAGTDHLVLAHLVRELLIDGADHGYLAQHAKNLDALTGAVEPYDRNTVAKRTDLAPGALDDLLAAVRRHGTLSAQTGTGTTMTPAANAVEWLTWALHIVTASYERPGGMWFHPGYLKQLDTRDISTTEATPAPGPPSRPELPGRLGEYPCAAIADEIDSGNLRALFVLGGNPVTSLPESERLVPLLAELDLLVVSDVAQTATTAIATHVLPCHGQLERPDLPHYIDQFQPAIASHYTDRVVRPVAERRPMWWPYAHLARSLDLDVLDGRDPDEVSEEELLAPLAQRSRSSFEDLRDAPSALVAPEPQVFGWVEERVLEGGRWDVAPVELVEQFEGLEDPPSLVLTPRRQLRHLNSQLTDSPRAGRPEARINPDDARGFGVSEGEAIRLIGPGGVLEITASIDEGIRRGTVSVPHGWPGVNVSHLTSATAAIDPLTGMVTQSGVPVRIEPLHTSDDSDGTAATSRARLDMAPEPL
ncbi:MAG: molybdopterin-dependent oxidoreductase [Microthrixaceae bacterium]